MPRRRRRSAPGSRTPSTPSSWRACCAFSVGWSRFSTSGRPALFRRRRPMARHRACRAATCPKRRPAAVRAVAPAPPGFRNPPQNPRQACAQPSRRPLALQSRHIRVHAAAAIPRATRRHSAVCAPGGVAQAGLFYCVNAINALTPATTAPPTPRQSPSRGPANSAPPESPPAAAAPHAAARDRPPPSPAGRDRPA